MALASGHTVEVLEELARLIRDFKGYNYKKGFVRLTPGSWFFPKTFLNFADNYYKFKFHPNDVVIATYPKCGTTWTQEIVWTMRNNPDLDNSSKDSLHVNVKFPFLEADMLSPPINNSSSEDKALLLKQFHMICPRRNTGDGLCLQLAECAPHPRTIKTHFPFSLLPPSLVDTCKVVYVARNPKDLLVSYHHHARITFAQAFNGTWEDFVQYFVDGNLMYGNYAEHIKEAWEKKNHPNLHIIFYEDLKANVMGELKRLDTFLGTKLTPQQLANVARHASFQEMKKRGVMDTKENHIITNVEITKKEGGFFRKGETGDWKNKFSPELEAKVDAWIEKNMKNIGVDFKYSI